MVKLLAHGNTLYNSTKLQVDISIVSLFFLLRVYVYVLLLSSSLSLASGCVCFICILVFLFIFFVNACSCCCCILYSNEVVSGILFVNFPVSCNIAPKQMIMVTQKCIPYSIHTNTQTQTSNKICFFKMFVYQCTPPAASNIQDVENK